MLTWGQTFGRIETTFPIAYTLSPIITGTVCDPGNAAISSVSIDWITSTQFYAVAAYMNNYYDKYPIYYISIGY